MDPRAIAHFTNHVRTNFQALEPTQKCPELTNGTFITLQIGICRTDGSITMRRLSERESFETLDGPLFDPQCRVCKAEARHHTWIGRKVASYFKDHTPLCMDLEDDDLGVDTKYYILCELDEVAKEIKEKQEKFEKIVKRIEAKVYENIPAARDLQIVFRSDILARLTIPKHTADRRKVRASLQDTGKGEIARVNARCCYVHALNSLAKAVKAKMVYADAPPPYSPEPECSNCKLE
ncbi:hypothetical protein K458DRAFT_395757 [Lentithecium fluviatile CBS 122367]|uniref:Uncharacterized protein n=1 Tax=Lentithecium fluviatile CBS 122367 TaxID=1168545 RepID=A0A6G1IHH8_9PLEO|nr:hypothetical protein K458DRAFT_395757 [Lentithecium fluviatile CBS 122367]